MRHLRGAIVRDLIKAEAAWILAKMVDIGPGAEDYQYYQGRIDSLAWALKQLPEEG